LSASGYKLISKVLADVGMRRYLENTTWLFFARLANITSSILVGIYVIKYLGPDNLGEIAYAIAFVSVFAPIATLGMNAVLIRELTRQPDRVALLLGTSFRCIAGASALLFVVVVSASQIVNENSVIVLYVSIYATTLFFKAFNVIDFYFQKVVSSRYVVFCQVATTLVSALVYVFLIVTEAEPVFFVGVYVLHEGFLAIFLAFAYRRRGAETFYNRFDFSHALSLVRSSWPLIFAAVSVGLYMKVDQIMLQHLRSSAEVGIYAVAVRFSEQWYLVPTLVAQSLFPAMLNAQKQSDQLFESRHQSLNDLLIWMNIVFVGIVYIIAEPLINILFGSDFEETGTVLSIHVLAGIFVSASIVRSKWLVSIRGEKYALYSVFFGLVLNVILNFFLIPVAGVEGAAVSTVFSRAASLYFMGIAFPATRPSLKAFHLALLLPVRMVLANTVRRGLG